MSVSFMGAPAEGSFSARNFSTWALLPMNSSAVPTMVTVRLPLMVSACTPCVELVVFVFRSDVLKAGGNVRALLFGASLVWHSFQRATSWFLRGRLLFLLARTLNRIAWWFAEKSRRGVAFFFPSISFPTIPTSLFRL